MGKKLLLTLCFILGTSMFVNFSLLLFFLILFLSVFADIFQFIFIWFFHFLSSSDLFIFLFSFSKCLILTIFPDYYERGFYTLQFALMKSLLEYLEPKSVDFFNQTQIALQRHPYPPFNDDKMVMVLQNQLPFILIISFELLALNIVKDIVEEKEKRLKVNITL